MRAALLLSGAVFQDERDVVSAIDIDVVDRVGAYDLQSAAREDDRVLGRSGRGGVLM